MEETEDRTHGRDSGVAGPAAQFVVRCTYGPEALAKRDRVRPEHLAYLHDHRDRIRFAGPYLEDDGSGPVGNIAIIDVADRAAAERFARDEPFTREGMISEVSIERCAMATEARQVGLVADPGLQLFVCESRDAPGTAELRKRTVPEQAAFHETLGERLLAHGRLLEDDGEIVTGDVRILAAPDRQAAREIVVGDPLHRAAVSTFTGIRRWRFGAAIGSAA